MTGIDEKVKMENGSFNNCPDMPSQQIQAEGKTDPLKATVHSILIHPPRVLVFKQILANLKPRRRGKGS